MKQKQRFNKSSEDFNSGPHKKKKKKKVSFDQVSLTGRILGGATQKDHTFF